MQLAPTSRHARRRALSTGAALAAGAALAFAGCGGSARSAAGAADVAAFIPAGSPVYVEVSTDLSSPQWEQALALAQRFPGYPTLVADATKELAADGVDFNTQVRPLLGRSAAVGVSDITTPTTMAGATNPDAKFTIAVDLADGKESQFISLIQTGKDPAKKVGTYKGFDIYGDQDAVLAVVDGTVVAAKDQPGLQRAIDAHQAGADQTMAGSTRLADAFAKLPDEVIAQGFVDVGTLLRTSGPEAAKQLANAGIGPDASVAFSVSAEADGVRLKGVGLGFDKSAKQAEEFTPKLLDHVPADAIAYVGLRNAYAIGSSAVAQLSGDPQVKQGLDRAKVGLALLGISLDDIKGLTSGEHAIVVTKGTPVPAAVAALEVADPAGATRTLDKLRTTLPALLGTTGTKIPPFAQVDLAHGVKGWESPISPKASAVYGVDGNIAYIGTKAAAIRTMQAPASTLADDPSFQAATRQMPAKVTALIWVDGDGLLTTLDGLGALKDAPKDVIANVRPLKNLVAWGVGGDTPTFEAFLTIK